MRPTNPDLSHVAKIKDSRARSHSSMLLNDTRVLHGHLPPSEINHAGPKVEMLFKESGATHQVSVRASYARWTSALSV
jgi:hypothetical protein